MQSQENVVENSAKIHAKICRKLNSQPVDTTFTETSIRNIINSESTTIYTLVESDLSDMHPYIDIDCDSTCKLQNDLNNNIKDFLTELFSIKFDHDFVGSGYSNIQEIAEEFKEYISYNDKSKKFLSIHIHFYDVTLFKTDAEEFVKNEFISKFSSNIRNFVKALIDDSVFCNNLENMKKLRLMFTNGRTKNNELKYNKSTTYFYTKSGQVDKCNKSNNILDSPGSSIVDLVAKFFPQVNLTIVNYCPDHEYKPKRHIISEEAIQKMFQLVSKPVIQPISQPIIQPVTRHMVEPELDFVKIPVQKYFGLLEFLIDIPDRSYMKLCYTASSIFHSFITANPYEFNELIEHLIKFYDSTGHDNHSTSDFISTCRHLYQQVDSNIFLFTQFKYIKQNINKQLETKLNSELELSVDDADKILSKTNDKLSKQQRELKKSILKIKQEINQANGLEIVKDIKQTLAEYQLKLVPYTVCNNKYKQMIFVNTSTCKYMMKTQHNNFREVSTDDIITMFPRNSIQEIRTNCLRLNYNSYEFNLFKIINNYDEMYIEHEAKYFIEQFAETFTYYDDCLCYLRYLAEKCFKPNSLLEKNLMLYGGSGSFKTAVLDTISEYVNVSKESVKTLTNSQFNSYVLSDLINIDEIQNNEKNSIELQNLIKQLTSMRYTTVREKYAKPYNSSTHFNLIINTNFKNCGGIFDKQSTGCEMFRRFIIISKLNQSDINPEVHEYLRNTIFNSTKFMRILKYIYDNYQLDVIKQNPEEYADFVNYVDSTDDEADKFKKLAREDVDACIDTDHRLSVMKLAKLLNVKNSELKKYLLDKCAIAYKNKAYYSYDDNYFTLYKLVVSDDEVKQIDITD